MKIYAYNLREKVKFETTVEEILRCINVDGGFSIDEYFYVTEEDRDFHFKENTGMMENE
tara:strand:+ start:1962 stop:2138 length:177 start_codon:yes stop_codon:yes gene_type:complete